MARSSRRQIGRWLMMRYLPPDLWLPAEDAATGGTCTTCGYQLWWVEPDEDPEMLGQRCWHCRTCRPFRGLRRIASRANHARHE
jgi:hypothetical protein